MTSLGKLLIFSICAAVALLAHEQLLAQSGSSLFVKVNPAGTYLTVDPCDQATPATSVTLSSLGIVPGEFIKLTRTGAFQAGIGFTDTQSTLGAIFKGPSGLISPGLDSQHAAFNSLATACSGISTNIAEDFNVAPQTAVQVPAGAAEILFTGNDSFWSDNTDPNNDYGLLLEWGLPWTLIVTTTADSGAGSLRAAIATANSDGAPTTIIFDPVAFPSASPGAIAPVTALPNLTGPGDTIDGSGASVILDGRNFDPLDQIAGLRVRASDVTIQSLTFTNFSGNDAVVVEGRDNRPVVTDVMISGNSFFNNRRGIRIDGGVQLANTTVSASVLDNVLQDNNRGILVRGNGLGSDGGNTVAVLIDGNLVQGKTVNPEDAGSGINLQGGSDIGSYNNVTAVVTNNTLTQIRNDGIVANGCSGNATGSHNTVNATITGNNVKFNRNLPATNLFNNGIIVTGATGETEITSFCSFNTISFLVSENNVSGFKTINITVSGGDEGTNNNTVQGTVLANHVSGADGRGIQVSGGTGNNHSVTVLISENISNSNGIEGIRVTAGTTGNSNIVALAGVINNTASRNGGDGIGIRSNIPGINGGTPISDNRTDRNGEDGIDINSTGYILSGNRASRNTGDGINAIGNVNEGGNVATLNGSCNTPGCF
jgi:hypothetical protein